jgi:predicted transcriptional regulator
MSQKETMLEAIKKLPENARYDDAIEEIRILQRIEEGEQAADEGRVRPHDELRGLIRSWIGE